MCAAMKTIRLAPVLLIALLAACGGGSDDMTPDAAVDAALTAIDARVVDARVVDARPAGNCNVAACMADGVDKRCDEVDQCTSECGGAGGSTCSLGFVCEQGRCNCNVLSCGSLGMGRRCVVNNTGSVNVPGGVFTLCTNRCGAGWPPCPNGYDCPGTTCERAVMP